MAPRLVTKQYLVGASAGALISGPEVGRGCCWGILVRQGLAHFPFSPAVPALPARAQPSRRGVFRVRGPPLPPVGGRLRRDGPGGAAARQPPLSGPKRSAVTPTPNRSALGCYNVQRQYPNKSAPRFDGIFKRESIRIVRLESKQKRTHHRRRRRSALNAPVLLLGRLTHCSAHAVCDGGGGR